MSLLMPTPEGPIPVPNTPLVGVFEYGPVVLVEVVGELKPGEPVVPGDEVELPPPEPLH